VGQRRPSPILGRSPGLVACCQIADRLQPCRGCGTLGIDRASVDHRYSLPSIAPQSDELERLNGLVKDCAKGERHIR
jgi:hypothetical protein